MRIAQGEFGGVPSSGIQSHEEYTAFHKWWAKPEVYSKVGRPENVKVRVVHAREDLIPSFP